MTSDREHLTGQVALSPSPSYRGPIRRLFDGWKRLEDIMDYTSYDYMMSRLNTLEARVIELEARLAFRESPRHPDRHGYRHGDMGVAQPIR